MALRSTHTGGCYDGDASDLTPHVRPLLVAMVEEALAAGAIALC